MGKNKYISDGIYIVANCTLNVISIESRFC